MIIPFFINLFRFKKTEKKELNVVRINEDTFIVNNRLISFSDENVVDVYKQKEEDRKHYLNYERQKKSNDYNIISNDYFKTKEAISRHPSLLQNITENDIALNKQKYERYVKQCKVLTIDFILSEKEFCTKEKNVAFCVDFSNRLFIPSPMIYNIFNSKTAKYKDNYDAEIRKEFKEKNY